MQRRGSSVTPPTSPSSRSSSRARSCATSRSRTSWSTAGRARTVSRRAWGRSCAVSARRCCSPISSARCSIRCRRWRHRPPCRRSSGCCATRCRSTSISPGTAIWPSGWGVSSALNCPSTSTIRTSPAASRNSGGAGTSRWGCGSANTCTSRSAETAAGRSGCCAISLSSGA